MDVGGHDFGEETYCIVNVENDDLQIANSRNVLHNIDKEAFTFNQNTKDTKDSKSVADKHEKVGSEKQEDEN